jgi:hypothetical protein
VVVHFQAQLRMDVPLSDRHSALCIATLSRI